MLVASESLCAACGIVLFVLGLLCCFIPRHFKFGVLTLLLGDLFFACAIVFPRRILQFLKWWGFDPLTLEQRLITQGVIMGLLIFALCYGLFRIYYRYRYHHIDVENTSQRNIPPEELPINRLENDDRRFALDSIDKHFFQKSVRVKLIRKLLKDHEITRDLSSNSPSYSDEGKP